MAAPAATSRLRVTVSTIRDVGLSPVVVNDDVEYDKAATYGYTVSDVIRVSTATTDQVLAISANCARLVLEETTGLGFKLKIGSTGATQTFHRLYVMDAPAVDDVGIASGVNLYLTNDGVSQIEIRRHQVNTVP